MTRISKKNDTRPIKGTERLTCSRKLPIVDQIEFGFGRAVAVLSDVVADILNSVCEKFTLLVHSVITRKPYMATRKPKNISIH